MVEEKSLKITGANKTFFTKLTTTINKILIPTKVGINGLLISTKRNSMIKAFEKFNSDDYYNASRLTMNKVPIHNFSIYHVLAFDGKIRTYAISFQAQQIKIKVSQNVSV